MKRPIKNKSKSLRIFLFLQFLGLFLLGGHLYLQQQKGETVHKSANFFQKNYLASIRNSIDLGKSLNSYSDIIYEEVRSPRGRDVELFAKKAMTSADLVFGSSVLSASKRKDLKYSFEQVMAKGEAVLEKLESGAPEVAREVFEKDFRDKLKAFHLNLDSHKKYSQHQASRYFSNKFLSQSNQGGLPELGLILIGLGALSLFGTLISLKLHLAALFKDLGDKERERSDLADKLYEKVHLVENMRSFCERALGKAPSVSASPHGISRPARPSLKKLESKLKNFSKECFAGLKESEKQHENNNLALEQLSFEVQNAEAYLGTLNNFKRNVLNLQISAKGDFAGSEEFLRALGELEKALVRIGQYKERFEKERPRDIKGEVEEHIAGLEYGLEEASVDIDHYSKELSSHFSAEARSLEQRLAELESWLRSRNESLARALVMSDPEEDQTIELKMAS